MGRQKRNVFKTALICFFLAIALSFSAYGVVPPQLNYQGYLTDADGNPVDGMVDMTFKIYNVDSGGAALWTETQPDVEVTNGIYHVQIGSVVAIPYNIIDGNRYLGITVETDPEMIPRQMLTSAPFAIKSQDSDTLGGLPTGSYIQQGEPNSITSGMIQPDAITAADIGIDAVGAAEIGSGAVGASEVANNSLTAADLAADSVGNSELAPNSVGSDEIIDGAVKAADIADGPGSGLNADLLDGLTSGAFTRPATDFGRSGVASNLYEGTSTLASKYVNTTGDSMTGQLTTNTTGRGILVDANPVAGTLYGISIDADQSAANNNTAYGLYIDTDSDAPGGQTYGIYANAYGEVQTYGVFGFGRSDTSDAYGLYGHSYLAAGSNKSSRSIYGVGYHYGTGALYGTDIDLYHNGSSGITYGSYIEARGSDSGTVYGIRASSTKLTTDTSGNAYGGYFIADNDRAGTGYGIYGISNGTGGTNYGVLGTANSGTTNYGGYFSATGGDALYARTYTSNMHAAEFYTGVGVGLAGAALYTRSYNSSNGGIALWAHNDHTTSTDATAVLSNDGSGPLLKGFGGNGGEDEFRFNNDGTLYFFNSSHETTVVVDPEEGSGGVGGQITMYNGTGTATIQIDGDFGGDGRITTNELQITGGSDLSEQFDVNPIRTAVKPGMVVSIDPEKPGELQVSTDAYDKKVAGIISGANGVKPGMMMGQQGTEADGAYPVALTGRVYCLADASNGPIEPGDLLTTSTVPGHAMRVADYPKAQGAILGKAMSQLDTGQGMVLVLVTLQ